MSAKSCFLKRIRDPESPIAFDFSYPNRPVLIAFGGIQGALGIPPFEFFNLCDKLDVNKIFVRDIRQSWYHAGLPDLSRNVRETVMFLDFKIEESQSTNLIVIGNSMGGYASILFGLLLNAETIHAFSPQTFIDKVHRFIYLDNRWTKRIRAMHKVAEKQYLDLINIVKSNNKSQINIYYSTEDRLDKIHACRLKKIPNVKLYSYKKGGHSVVKILKRSGELQKIIQKSIISSS